MTRSDLNKALEYFTVRLTALLVLSVLLFLIAGFIYFLGPYIVIVLAAFIGFVGLIAIIFSIFLIVIKTLMKKAIEGM